MNPQEIKKLLSNRLQDLFDGNLALDETKEENAVLEDGNIYKNLINIKGLKDGSSVEISDVNFGTKTIINVQININSNDLTKENAQGSEESEIARRIKAIEKLQEENKYFSAIEAYDRLLNDYNGQDISIDDRFLILNGKFNCYINLNDDESVKVFMQKIYELGTVAEIHRFHFLCSIYYLNKRDLDKSYLEIRKAVEHKPDYFRGASLKVFVESDMRTIDYETALCSLIDENENPILGDGKLRDNSYAYNLLGYISLSFKKNDEAIKFFKKSHELTPSKSLEAQIGIAHFQKAVEKSNGIYIRQKDVDFIELNKAISMFNELYFVEDAEVRRSIRIQISSFYFRSLFLANNYRKVNNIFEEMKEYCPNERTELYRIKALSEAMEGPVNAETLKELSVEDKEWIKFVDLMNTGKSASVIEELEPVIWSNHREEERYHGMLLHAYLENDELKKFVKHFREYKKVGKVFETVSLMEGLYYEKIGDLETAERIIKDIALDNSDYLLYEELILFYERNALNDQLEALYDDLFTNKKHIIEPRIDKFYYKCFLFLFRTKRIVKALELFNTVNSDDLGEINYKKISAEIKFLIGDYINSALEYESLHKETNDLEDVFSSLIAYLAYNNTEKAEEMAKLLIERDYRKKVTLYSVYSNIEILKGDIDRAYEYAKIAKDIDKENPDSNAHPFYIQRSIRCNKDEGKAYIHEYAYKYPEHREWLKGYKALEVDEEGNEKLSEEIIDVLETMKMQFNEYVNSYKNRSIGITTLAKVYGQTLPEIVNWRYWYGIKVKITSGDINEVNEEVNAFEKKIVIDAFGLYILAEIDYLSLLRQFDSVYITYSTIASLQQTLMHNENSKVREILSFIDESINLEIVNADYKLSKELSENIDVIFEKNQVESVAFSFTTGIPYIYSDPFVKGYYASYNIKFINFVAFFRASVINGILDRESLSDVVLNLKRNKYDFINFDALDIYNIALKADFEVTDDTLLFFTLEKGNDFPSFIGVYSRFLNMIYNQIDKQKFDKFFDLYVTTFNKYLKKRQYYLYVIERFYGDEFGKVIKTLEYRALLGALSLGADLSEALLNSPELNRAIYLTLFCHGALRFILHMFKDTPDDYEHYCNRLRPLVNNISAKDIEKIIEDGRNLSLVREEQE